MLKGPKLLFADRRGQVMEHPRLLATVRSGEELLLPQERPIPLPGDGKLVHLPGRLPVGVDPETGELEPVRAAHAVGAVLAPGYTRTLLPGEVQADGPTLPQWAYTAAAWGEGGPVVWAARTDRRTHWSPHRFSTPELKAQVAKLRARLPGNRVIAQLEKCALVYRCFTSQNTFYCRDEGAIPASVACNARCVGCISEQPASGPPSSHQRIEEGPSAEEMAQVGIHHLRGATGRTMVSFGQGCEGEPLTRHRQIAQAIRLMRQATLRGSINLNTNASLPDGLDGLLREGLDAVRISLNSASPDLYAAYYQPIRYGFSEVEASMALVKKRGAYLALNLLLFPGVSDQAGEVEALCRLVRRYRVDQVQARSLCIDPASYLAVAKDKGAGGEALGIRTLLARLTQARPGLIIGNFARAKGER